MLVAVKETHVTESILQTDTNNAVKKSVSQTNLKVSTNADIQVSTIKTVPSIFDAFANSFIKKAVPELKLEGYMLINESHQNNVYSTTLALQEYIDEVKIITHDLLKQDVKIPNSSDYKPRVEDFVCFKEENSWYRGYILKCPSISNFYTIMAIDDARILQSSKVLPCPKQFSKIFALGVTCIVDHFSIKLQVGKEYKVIIVVNEQNHKQKRLPIKIFKYSEIITATIKLWEPEIKESLKPTVSPSPEFKNGSKICLTSYQNHYVMYARSLEEVEIEHYYRILQRVALCAQTAPRLSKPPSVGQKVIAPFCDGNNYRAEITRIQDKVEVKYIDFGNKYEVDTKDLQILPDDLALEKTCLRNIFLRDVPRDVLLNTDVDIYLRNLIGKKVIMTCMYEGVFEDGVYLKTYSGENVNNKIKDLLTPSWKRSDYDDTTCYMWSTNIEVASLGREGDTINAIILNIIADGQKYYMCPVDGDLIFYIEKILPALLKQYSKEMTYYVPRSYELCLVLHDGTWYRALCIDPRKTNRIAAEVFLVDYGNIITVKHEDIRLMPKEYIVPPLLANMTKVINLVPFESSENYSSAIQQRIKQLVKLDSVVKIKIVKCFESGDYEIELPDVHATLIKEGLVSSSQKKL